MIDTHTHLYDEAFDADFQETLDRAIEVGVERFIFPGIDSGCHDRMMEAAARTDGRAYPAVGLHPTSVKEDWKNELAFVENKLGESKWCAIGEIGLDCYWSRDFLQQQKEVFRKQMQWAAQADISTLIHIREAHDVLFEILEELQHEGTPMRGIMHAFSGSIETYRRIKRYGDFRIGIGGVITYKKAGIAETIKEIPLEDIVLETDSPWLTPAPFRGKRNEPSYLKYIKEKIALLKEVTPEEVDRITTDNTIKLFNL